MISRRFCGPPGSGNGGYVSGLIAGHLGGDVEVTLRLPPPLDTELVVEVNGSEARVLDAGRLIAEANRTHLDIDIPAPVTFAEAVSASAAYPWAGSDHPYPTCFVCGPDRAAGDGLRLSPGAVPGRRLVSTPWVPDNSVADDEGVVPLEIIWAALDCPSWFGVYCFDPQIGPALLGRMSARVIQQPTVGQRLVVMGWSLGREGRKIWSGSALYDEDGAVLAIAQTTWITIA